MAQPLFKSVIRLHSYVVINLILIMFLSPITAIGAKNIINYDEQIVVTTQPNAKFKKVFAGLDLKKIKNLKIKDAPNTNTSLDFWDSYDVLKKMIALETLDVTECEQLNTYLYDDSKIAQLPITTLILRNTTIDLPKDPFDAAIFIRNGSPISFGRKTPHYESNYPNLKELVIVWTESNHRESDLEENELYANLDFGNSFVASYNTKQKVIRYRRLENLNRQYQILLYRSESRDVWDGYCLEFAKPIPPQNTQLEGVVVTDGSFANYLPEKTAKLTIPSTIQCILADGPIHIANVDTLLVEHSDLGLAFNHHGLYGIDNIKYAEFNRPVYFNNEPGPSIFSGAKKIVFNKNAVLDYANLGYGIKEIIFNGKTQIYSTLTDGAESISFNDDVSINYDHYNSSRPILKDVGELMFKKAPEIEARANFENIKKVFIPVGFKDTQDLSLFRNAKEMNFDTKTVIDPRITPNENIKIKPLKFNDPHIHDVELGGN